MNFFLINLSPTPHHEALRLLPKVLQRPRIVSLVRGILEQAGSAPLVVRLPRSRSPWLSHDEMLHKTCQPSTPLCSLCPQAQMQKSLGKLLGALFAIKSCSQSSSHSSKPVRRTFAQRAQHRNATWCGQDLRSRNSDKPDEVSLAVSCTWHSFSACNDMRCMVSAHTGRFRG